MSEKLDLSSLKSYSPHWPHELRLAVCIAIKYSIERLYNRSQAIGSLSYSASSLSTNGTVDARLDQGVELNEEGRPLGMEAQQEGEGEQQQQRMDEITPPASARSVDEEKRRKELVESWHEFGSKFLTATCQHLGVAEESLPPGPLRIEEVLEIGQGKPSEGESTFSVDAQRRALQLEAKGQETGDCFAREHPDLVLRADVEEEEQRRGHVKKEEMDDGGVEENDQDIEDASLTLAATSISKNIGESKPPQPPCALCVQRSGGALASENGTSSRDFEVFNDLLLIALGLGQYRSLEDGATMVFENEAVFGEEPMARKSKTVIPEASPSQSTPDPSPAGVQAELAYQQHPRSTGSHSSVINPPASAPAAVNAWGAFSKWADTSLKSVGNLFPPPPSAQPVKTSYIDGASDTPDGSTGDSARKSRQQPNEFCHYDARARAIIFVAANALGLSKTDGHSAEKIVAQTIYFIMNDARSAAAKKGKDPLKQQASGVSQEQENSGGRTTWMNKAGTTAVEEHGRSNWKRWAAAGGGAAVGAGIIGLTGGLAAPILLPALASLSGVAFFASSGGIVLAAALFGIGGGGLAGYRVSRRLRGLESFEFKEVETPARRAGVSIPSLHATICVSGIILEEGQQVDSWQEVWGSSNARDVYIVSSEARLMSQAGTDLQGYVFSRLKGAVGQRAAEEVVKRTALAGFTALTIPLTVANAIGSALDSMFVRAKSKAVRKGLVLAEVLAAEVQGHRPVILIGTSLGCISILTALNELAKDPDSNSHLVDSVYLISGPATSSRRSLSKARSIVARRFVNAFSQTDKVCSVAAWLGMELSAEDISAGRAPRVMGSSPVWGIPGVENIDVSDLVPSHFDLVESDKLRLVCERIGVNDG